MYHIDETMTPKQRRKFLAEMTKHYVDDSKVYTETKEDREKRRARNIQKEREEEEKIYNSVRARKMMGGMKRGQKTNKTVRKTTSKHKSYKK